MLDLSIVLEQEYDITPIEITPQECGLSALAYRVQTADELYFLKVYDKSKKATAYWTALIDHYIPVIYWLNQNTALRGRIVNPIKTAHGKNRAEDDTCIYMVFTYIHGYTVGAEELTVTQAEELAHIIGILHQHSAATIPGHYERMTEDFRVPFCVEMKRYLEKQLYHNDNDVKEIIIGCLPQLTNAIEKAMQKSKSLSESKPKMVFCHTDLHNFNIMQGEKLVLIDWEGLKLAPPEHDLMFVYGKPYFDAFMRVYRGYHAGFQINSELLDFYRLRRDLEDIWAFIEEVTHDILAENDRKRSLNFLRHICSSLS